MILFNANLCLFPCIYFKNLRRSVEQIRGK